MYICMKMKFFLNRYVCAMVVMLMLFLQLIIMFVFVVGCCTICNSEATSEGRRVGGLCLLPLIVHLLSIINSKNYLFVVYVLYNNCIKKDIFTYFTFWCFLINVKYIVIVWSVVAGNCPILFRIFSVSSPALFLCFDLSNILRILEKF